MKITKRQLRNIIREERNKLLSEAPMSTHHIQGQTATSLAEALADEVLYIVAEYVENNEEVSERLEDAIYDIVAKYLSDVNISSDFENMVRK